METKQLLIRSILLLTLFFIGCGDSGRATQSVLPTPDVKYTPGDIITDSQGYISYRVGNTPIIITVPHDGTLTPSTFPDRTGASTRAENTRKIAEQFAYFFNANSNGLYPHIIYNNVSRSKLDPDLNQMDGAQGNSYANLSYGTYHSFLQTAIDSVEAYFDAGILLNLVEHNHSNQRVELGYLLSASDLDLTNLQLNSYSSQSSVSHIANLSSSSFAEVIRGYNSLGTLIVGSSYTSNDVNYTFEAVPTLETPNVGNSDYSSGGYTITQYGSSNGGKINGIDVATPFAGFRDNANAYRALAVILEGSVKSFYQENLGIILY
jgi:hypothetical protein